MELTIGVESSNNLVLGWHIQLFHDFVKFLAQFDIFAVQSRDLAIFLSQEELKILHFILGLAVLTLPLEIGAVSMLAVLDQLEVKVVVFFDDTLIFGLKRRHRLSV